MTKQPKMGGFVHLSINYMQPPLIYSVLKENCLDGKTTIHETITLGNGRHTLNFYSYLSSGAIFQSLERNFINNFGKFFTLTIQFVLAGLFLFSAAVCAFGERPARVTCGIL
jgi:hypothetical protein